MKLPWVCYRVCCVIWEKEKKISRREGVPLRERDENIITWEEEDGGLLFFYSRQSPFVEKVSVDPVFHWILRLLFFLFGSRVRMPSQLAPFVSCIECDFAIRSKSEASGRDNSIATSRSLFYSMTLSSAHSCTFYFLGRHETQKMETVRVAFDLLKLPPVRTNHTEKTWANL